jgi:hypothetical protein
MDSTIVCPSCKTEIKLTESLAGPLLETTRRDYEQRLAVIQSGISQRNARFFEAEADKLVGATSSLPRSRASFSSAC